MAGGWMLCFAERFLVGQHAGPVIQRRAAHMVPSYLCGPTYEMLNCISPYDHEFKHRSIASRRVPGTAEWIFGYPEYEQWYEGTESSVLICSGSVGCGKSLLASSVIDRLLNLTYEHGAPVIHYYCDASLAASVSAADILRSIIKQILLYRRRLHLYVAEEFLESIEAVFVSPEYSPQENRVRELFGQALRMNTGAYLVVDGVDVLEEEEAHSFFRMLRESSQNGFLNGVKLLIFTREILGRGIDLAKQIRNTRVLHLTICELRGDIRLYVHHEVDRKQEEYSITEDRDLLEEIKRVLIARGEKMFLWIYFQLVDIWMYSHSDNETREMLDDLPDGLDATYARCLERIEFSSPTNNYQGLNPRNCQRSRKRKIQIAMKTLRWAACAERPLALREAREFISIDVGKYDLDPGNTLNINPADYCANLVSFGFTSRGLNFTHPSVKQFLMDTSRLSQHLTHYAIDLDVGTTWCGETCLTFMGGLPMRSSPHVEHTKMLARVSKGVGESLGVLRFIDRLRQVYQPSQTPTHQQPSQYGSAETARALSRVLTYNWTITSYVQDYWLVHTKSIADTSPLYADFTYFSLEPHKRWQAWYNAEGNPKRSYQLLIKCAISLAHLPLLRLCANRVPPTWRQDVFEKSPGKYGRLPLHYAATIGNLEVVKELLKYCSPSSHDEEGNTAAIRAAENGHTRIIKYLYNNYRVNIRHINGNGDSIPSIAAYNDNAALVDWWFNLQGLVTDTGKLVDHITKSLQAGCRGAAAPTNSIVRILKECVRLGTPAVDEGTLIDRIENVASIGSAYSVLASLHNSRFLETMFAEWPLRRVDMKSVSEKAADFPPEPARLVRYQILPLCGGINRNLITNDMGELVDDALPWLPPIYYAIVPVKYTETMSPALISELLHLLEIMPDKMITDLIRSRSPSLMIKDEVGHGVLHSLAHRPTAQALYALNAVAPIANDINAVDLDGWTALHFAAKFDYEEIACFLLLHGADYARRTLSNKTPYDLAPGNGLVFQIIHRWIYDGMSAHYENTKIELSQFASVRERLRSEWKCQLYVFRQLMAQSVHELSNEPGHISEFIFNNFERMSHAIEQRLYPDSLSFPDDVICWDREMERWIIRRTCGIDDNNMWAVSSDTWKGSGVSGAWFPIL
ncbi:hypothetical protein BJX99DRAFT_194840 [Aspergillus californicus]